MAHDAGELSDAIPLRQDFLENTSTDSGQGRLKLLMVGSVAMVVGVFAGAATFGYSQGQKSYLMKSGDVYTTGGNAHEDSHCHFPFEWNGVWNNECTLADSDRPWCAVDDDDDQPDHSNAWGYCKEDEAEEEPVEVWGGEGTGTPDQVAVLNEPEKPEAQIFPILGGEGTGTPDLVAVLNEPEKPEAQIFPILGGEGTGTPEIYATVDPLPMLSTQELVITAPAGAIIAADQEGKQKLTLDDLEEFFPWVASGNGAFHPICGHKFWDNNDGAINICRKLGFFSGSIVKDKGLLSIGPEKFKFAVDANPVGQCNRRELLSECTAGGNHFDDFDADYFLGANCKKGEDVGFQVSCIGKSADSGTSTGEVTSYICAEQLLIGSESCTCRGSVKFGNGNDGWSESKAVGGGSIECDRKNFIEDILDPIVPLVPSLGNAHVCVCDL